ncbi:MAG: hypothetical protein A2887_04425 [Alphaproteobacteria bacterium RIFCSPLOWO2_01_FULL_40_26]|nr:MAG: hypothetical protein A3D15_03520 [Alphaproteobacteria bacterium RIFCSPHIGHO2_02_FULL_40_34]OFW86044.1 MAG: hypothetical protein A2794_02865 [Alphaproteobacteria bacterium RIFCSPHIGHO2_01_FULL_40_8]OFW95188.1 MAG: hypothetical protein A2887_04425 [Alphaproteobacteria bacterium RIFCSPLOWO2_01_FULL_40_26]OFX09977.1 MAG: hypothetical protein A3H30_02790 [Alphaproteobacteria bacterium RIFCSPLOWO2_02_FULL_40_19]OFX12329.1 MAG: hypothetical protein A3G22_03530 [Alphaproteobacteria bacterium RI
MICDKITPVDHHIAKRLRELRRAFGMSQDKLGELVGLTFQQIQKYETAKNRVSASKLFEIAQIIECPLSAFFQGIKADRMYYNYDFAGEKELHKKSQKIEKELLPLIQAFRRIEDNYAKQHLTALAKAIAKPKPKKIKHCYS